MVNVSTEPTTCEDLLARMVRLDTINGGLSGRIFPERPVAELLEATAIAMGLQTQRLTIDADSYNLLVTHRVRSDAPWLLFESHMDTVGVEGMTIDPFGATVEAGRMYGRGTCDTKSSGAAMLWALRRYAALGDKPRNVAVLFVVDEERSKQGATAFIERHLPALDWRPIGIIVGEPTLCRPVVAHNGCVRWIVRTLGVAAHSSSPENGRSAISMMARAVLAIESRYVAALTASHPMTGKAQCSINVIHGGSAVNIIPDCCEVQIDRRVVPGENPRDVLPAVKAVLDELRSECPELRYEQTEPFIDPPLDPMPSADFAAWISNVLNRAGHDGTQIGVRYGTDASTLASTGVPAVVLGPGDIAQAHTRDEWLALDELDRAVEVYLTLMRGEANP